MGRRRCSWWRGSLNCDDRGVAWATGSQACPVGIRRQTLQWHATGRRGASPDSSGRGMEGKQPSPLPACPHPPNHHLPPVDILYPHRDTQAFLAFTGDRPCSHSPTQIGRTHPRPLPAHRTPPDLLGTTYRALNPTVPCELA